MSLAFVQIVVQFLDYLAQMKQHAYVHRALEPRHILLQTKSDSFTGVASLSPEDELKFIGFSFVRPADPRTWLVFFLPQVVA